MPRRKPEDLTRARERRRAQRSGRYPDFNGAVGVLLTTGCRDTFDNKHWNRARASVELPDGFDFHDLRHTALTLTGLVPDATVADLMRRGGHGSAEAGMRDRHSTDDNDRRIAERMNAMLLEAKARAIDAPCADETWIDNEPGAADADA